MADDGAAGDGGPAAAGSKGVTDRVVRELDVYCCNGILGASTSLFLFQYPLRPPWRPYGQDAESEAVRYKPGVRRVEVDVPLEAGPANFNEHAGPELRRRQHRLTSAPVELKTSYAVGSVRGDKVLLCQLDDAVQMRPSLAHLDEPAAGKGDEGRDGKRPVDSPAAAGQAPDAAEPKVLKVQVQRRETERQQEARLQSHAYLKEQEEKEAWVSLVHHPVDSPAAEKIWEQLMTPGGEDISADVSCQEYLQAVVPHAGVRAEAAGAAEDAMEVDAIKPEPAFEVTEAAQAALPEALHSLFRHHNVCSLDNIRKWLLEFPDAGAASQLGAAPDTALHGAALKCPTVRCIRGSYLLRRTGLEEVDRYRELLLGLLEEKPQVKRSEIKDAVKQAQLEFTDTMLTKVLKSICITRGNGWCLKASI
mmetsp:Transcript_4694/g.11742  ORF Transcript_4694/g.11742 Transcript_4694/m.11742 type:complete len:420 (+) Transcript_4694:132-1391(+)